MEKFRLSKISKHDCRKGNIYFSAPMSPLCAAQDIIKEIDLQCKVTQLHRVHFEDDELFTTWQDADAFPVNADILVVEVNYSIVFLFADLGHQNLPIMLDCGDGEDAVLTPICKKYEWIKKASDETLRVICKMALGKIAENKEELRKLAKKGSEITSDGKIEIEEIADELSKFKTFQEISNHLVFKLGFKLVSYGDLVDNEVAQATFVRGSLISHVTYKWVEAEDGSNVSGEWLNFDCYDKEPIAEV